MFKHKNYLFTFSNLQKKQLIKLQLHIHVTQNPTESQF